MLSPRKILQVILLGLLLFLANFAFAAEETTAKPLSFKEFYQKTLQYYPKLKQQDANLDLAIAKKVQAVSGFLPRVQGVMAMTHGDDPVYVFGSLLRESRFTSDNFALSTLNTPSPHTSYNFSVTGELPIFDALQTISRVKSAKLTIESAQYEKSFIQMEAFLVAGEAYLRAIAVENLLAAVEEVSKASEEDVQQAEDLKDKGLILGADFYSAKLRLGQITQLKNQLGREKQMMQVLLNILMGQDPLTPLALEGQVKEVAFESQSLENWFADAYRSRPDLVAIEKTIQAQGVEVSREKSTALPRVDAFGEAREDTHKLSENGGENFIVGVKAQVDLYDPSYASRVRMSKAALQKLEKDQTILKDSITRDVAQEFTRFQTVSDNLPLVGKMLEDARQAVDLMRPLYREGRKSIADLLEIRCAYVNTVRGYNTLATDLKVSWTRLLFLSGQLDEPHVHEAIQKISE